MAYGTLKVDNITYTSGGSDASTSVSGIVALAAGNFNNITATGTISGVTITGTTGQFVTLTAVTGIFTTTLSGATITGNTGQFTNLTGTTAGFTTITGTTVTGTTANFATVSGTVVTGATAGFTTVTGQTVTGTTANFVTVSGNTVTGVSINDGAGNVRNIPQNAQTSGYTLVAADAGKHVFTISGVTIPSGVFTVGQAVTIYNNTTGSITITQGTNVTLRQAGASGTGNRTLAQRGLATVLCVSGASGTEFVIGGAGIS